MDAFDDVLFTYALRDAFSSLSLYETSGLRALPPVTLAHASQTSIYVPDEEAGVAKAEPGRQWFQYMRSGFSYGDRVTLRWPVEFPYLTEGRLQTSWYADDLASEATVKKVWHLLTRVSANRIGRHYPGFSRSSSTGRYGIRFGHHALEWCAGSPDRVLGNRYRPADDWSVPKSKWYQDLRSRVIADYGKDFADPALRGPLVYIVGPVPPTSPGST